MTHGKNMLIFKEYRRIKRNLSIEHRPISNFITTGILKEIEESYYVDSIEMAQLRSDKRLQEKLKAGHNDVKRGKGRN